MRKIFGGKASLTLESSTGNKIQETTDWEGKLYIGIALKWDYEKGTVQLSMPGYVRAALNGFQHEKPKRLLESPYPWTQPVYSKDNQML